MENLVMNHSFWNNKKVLITGHTGFKGSWLSYWLHSLGAKVIGYALPPPTHPSLFELIHLKNLIQSHQGDIKDFNHLNQLIKHEQPEIVFHLAAQSLVRESYQDPLETYATNIMGTANLLEALRKNECTRVAIIVTSDKCYENREWWWGYRETDALGGHDPYSSSKGCAELVTAAYRHSYFSKANHPLFLASVRAGNVIGGGDFAKDRLIPDFFRAIEQKTTLKIRYPNAIRPWQHVLEPLNGYIMLAERLWDNGDLYADSWNFGPRDQDAKSVAWIANFLKNNYDDENINWECEQQIHHPHEAHYLKLDTSKSQLKLNWQPRLSLENALKLTINWQKAYRKNHDLKRIMQDQIANYIS